jgi:hypothetical protein
MRYGAFSYSDDEEHERIMVLFGGCIFGCKGGLGGVRKAGPRYVDVERGSMKIPLFDVGFLVLGF